MSSRIEIELTSERPDGVWTWRAAGAKQPKGELAASVLPGGASVGDILRADADFTIDGIDILSVLPPKATRKEPERLTLLGTGKDEPLVTTTLVEKKGRSRDGERRGRGRDSEGGRERGRRSDGPDRNRGDRPRSDRPRGPKPDPVPERAKPKRLRPGRVHRSAVLDSLPVEHRPIAEQVLRGGIPAVRDAIAKQNAEAKAQNRPEIPAEQLVDLAEKLLPSLRAAEWRDRADAAVAGMDDLDLRDLRSVIVAADGVARDGESLGLKDQIQAGLARRVEEEQAIWVADMTANLDAGRFVRVLRLSSRPPKAGAPLPVDISSRLITAVSEGLTPTVNQDLWAAALDALAFSPVRNSVVPVGRPTEPSDALLDAVRRVGDRLPKIVELFGLDPGEVTAAARKRGRGPRSAQGARSKKAKPAAKGARSTPETDDPPSTRSEDPAKTRSTAAPAEESAETVEPPVDSAGSVETAHAPDETADGPAETAEGAAETAEPSAETTQDVGSGAVEVE